VSPANDGNVLRLVLPELTQERRKEYVKLARSKAEDARVSVRSVRRSAKQTMDKMEKDGDVGKDDVTGAEKRLDGLTKKHTDAIDDLLKQKEAELLEL
jgi:ribosome recycling factor